MNLELQQRHGARMHDWAQQILERNALQKELAVVAASSREELEWRMEELPLLRPAGRS